MTSRLARLSVFSVLLLVGLGGLPACSGANEGDDEEEEEALVSARADIPGMAALAARLTERVRARDPQALVLPVVDGEAAPTLPSRTAMFESWSLSLLSMRDQATQQDVRAFVLLATGEKVPPGCFALVLIDEKSSVVATSAYVPDTVPTAADWAKSILDAIDVDARAFVAAQGGIRTQGFMQAAARGAVALMSQWIAATERRAVRAGAAVSAEARVAAVKSSELWAKIDAFFVADRTLLQKLTTDLVSVKTQLGARKVTFLHGNTSITNRFRGLTADDIAKVKATLSTKIDTRTGGLAVDSGDDMMIPAVSWALENRVPIVVSTTGSATNGLQAAIDRLVNSGTHPALRAQLEAALRDPTLASLVQRVDLTPVMRALQTGPGAVDTGAAQYLAAFVAGWSVAEKSLLVRLTESTNQWPSKFLARFESREVVSLTPR